MIGTSPSSPQHAPEAQPLPPPVSERPGGHVQQIVNGVVSFGILLSLAELGIADHLADRPRNVTDLAELCKTDPDCLHRILRAATSLGLLRATGQPGTYTLTREGRTLRQDLPDSMRPAVLMAADPLWLEAIRRLPETVRAGRPALPQPTYEYLAGNPDAGDLFHRFMRARTTPVAEAIAKLDFRGVRTVVDVGGGSGTVLGRVLRTHTHCTGILLERPDVAETAARHLAALGLRDRCETVEGDFFHSVPEGEDGAFTMPLQLTAGQWELTVTASSQEGKTTSLARTVTVAYRGVNLTIAVKGGPAWLKVWVDGQLADSVGASGRTIAAGKTLTFTAERTIEVRTGS